MFEENLLRLLSQSLSICHNILVTCVECDSSPQIDMMETARVEFNIDYMTEWWNTAVTFDDNYTELLCTGSDIKCYIFQMTANDNSGLIVNGSSPSSWSHLSKYLTNVLQHTQWTASQK